MIRIEKELVKNNFHIYMSIFDHGFLLYSKENSPIKIKLYKGWYASIVNLVYDRKQLNNTETYKDLVLSYEI